MKENKLKILNQLLLPFETKYENIMGVDDAADAIKKMKVRGAPAIAILAMLALSLEVLHSGLLEVDHLKSHVLELLNTLRSSRPTAVNLFNACDSVSVMLKSLNTIDDIKKEIFEFANNYLNEDVLKNKQIGEYGGDFILSISTSNNPIRILTHCNTGSLATGGYGTALGIIRYLSTKNLVQVFCTETRPYNQGSRLTAYELTVENLPNPTLICDSMVSYILNEGNIMEKPISAIVVGADRIAMNGDTANKIGTYQLAISAKYHGVPFIVAAPATTIDFNMKSGNEIIIEERNGNEVKTILGMDSTGRTEVVKIAADINVRNPAFDVTPWNLIHAIVTENGVFKNENGFNLIDNKR
jgi:methylthioribose-1-phosphate isomerase